MLPLEIRNPRDLDNTYLQIEIYRADTYSGSYTLLDTVNIDTSKASDLTTGYTVYNDATGDATKYYKFRYKNGAVVSEFSNIYQGGTCELDTRFRIEMADNNVNNYYFSNETVANFRRDAVYALWPATYFEDIDETITTLANTVKYTFPDGVTRINDIEYLDENDNVVGSPKNWKPRARQIIFSQQPPTGYKMRLYVDKMFTKISEVPEVFDEWILDYMRFKAFKVFEADRTQYYKYNALVKGDGSSSNSISSTIRLLKTDLESRLNKLRRVRKPATISLAN